MPCTRAARLPTRPKPQLPRQYDKHGKVRCTGGLFLFLRALRLLIAEGHARSQSHYIRLLETTKEYIIAKYEQLPSTTSVGTTVGSML